MPKQKENQIDMDQYWADLAIILSHMKRFRDAVKEFRKDHKISANGIPKKKRADWYSAFFLEPTIDPDKSFGSRSDYALLPPDKDFMHDLAELAIDFNLDSRWYPSLFLHIASGSKAIDPPLSSGVSIHPRVNDARLPEDKQIVARLMIEIRKDTKIADITKVMPRIQEYQKKMVGETPGKRRLINKATLKKYIQIRNMEDDHIPQSVIYEKFGFSCTEDVARFKSSEIEQRFTRPPMS